MRIAARFVFASLTFARSWKRTKAGDRDGGEDADDRDHDHELDQREAVARVAWGGICGRACSAATRGPPLHGRASAQRAPRTRRVTW